MKYFVANYSSLGNTGGATVWIKAKNIAEAQDRFFDYLKTTPLYQHMWRLNLEIEEVEPIVLL